MASGLLRTTFNRSELVRILSETASPAVDPQYDFGERLGKWLDFTDALTLYPVLNRETGSSAAAPSNAPGASSPLPAHLARVRRTLTDAILNDGVFNLPEAGADLPEGAMASHPPLVKIPFPTPLPGATPESAADFSPYHRYYLAHQRDMSGSIGTLRTAARKALAAKSAAHRQLAELDASFEGILTARERNLLATIPMHLGKRFDERYQDHLAALPAGATDDPTEWAVSGGWLEAFCQDTQAVLLAELDLRLKPVAGLIAALDDTASATPGAPTQLPM